MLIIGLISHVDGQGRIEADSFELWRSIFVADPDVTEETVDKWLDLLVENETIILYEADGTRYAQLTNWWGYQMLTWGNPSEYPAPEGWKDRIRTKPKGGNSVVTYNWTTSNGTRLPDTCDAQGRPLPQQAKPDDTPSSPSTNGEPTKEPAEVRTSEPTGRRKKIEDRRSEESDLYHVTEGGTEPPPSFPADAVEQQPQPPEPPYKQPPVEASELLGFKPAQESPEDTREARQRGVDPAALTAIVDAVLAATGKTAMANDPDDRYTLTDAKAVAMMFVRNGKTTPDAVIAVKAHYDEANCWRWKGQPNPTPPTFQQLKAQLSADIEAEVEAMATAPPKVRVLPREAPSPFDFQ